MSPKISPTITKKQEEEEKKNSAKGEKKTTLPAEEKARQKSGQGKKENLADFPYYCRGPKSTAGKSLEKV